MNPDNPVDQKDMEQELALKQAEIEKMKLELELEKMKQQSTQVEESANTSEPEPVEKEKWSERSGTLAFFTMFFPPLAIYFMCKLPHFKRLDTGTKGSTIAITLIKIGASIFIILAFLLWCALLYTLFFASFDLFG